MVVRAKRRQNLNAILIVASGVFFGYAVATVSPSTLARTTQNMLASASVSMSAAVAPTPESSIAAQLRAKEIELNEREAQIGGQGSTVEKQTTTTLGDELGALSLGISLVLLVLVAVNFYMDMRREGRGFGLGSRFAVDLRRRE